MVAITNNISIIDYLKLRIVRGYYKFYLSLGKTINFNPLPT